jgi:hypothetical protein
MNDRQKQLLVFFIGCIGIRTLFVYIAKNINKDYLPYMGYIFIVIAINMIYIYINKSRQIGILGQNIWWDNLRPIHIINYAIFAHMAINKSPNAWIILLVDVIIGLSAHLYYHHSKGDFNLLF